MGGALDDVRDLLMDPLSRHIPASQVWGVADALLPVVQALVAEGKAEALDEAADHGVCLIDVRQLREQAAALRATTSGEGA